MAAGVLEDARVGEGTRRLRRASSVGAPRRSGNRRASHVAGRLRGCDTSPASALALGRTLAWPPFPASRCLRSGATSAPRVGSGATSPPPTSRDRCDHGAVGADPLVRPARWVSLARLGSDGAQRTTPLTRTDTGQELLPLLATATAFRPATVIARSRPPDACRPLTAIHPPGPSGARRRGGSGDPPVRAVGFIRADGHPTRWQRAGDRRGR